MTWQISLIVSILSYATALLVQRVLLKDPKNDPIALSIIIPLTAGMILGVIALIKGIHFPDLSAILPNLILMMVLYGTSNILSYKALRSTEAAIFTIINTSRALWSIAAAILFLGESFSIKQFAGTLCIICSVLMVTWNGQELKLKKGEIFTLLAALAFGIEFINDAYILQRVDLYFYLPVVFTLPPLFVWTISPKATSKIKAQISHEVLWKVLLVAVLYAISAATLFLSYQLGRNAAQIASINETSTIVIVLLAVVFLRERSNIIRKFLAALIAVVGVNLVK